MKNIITKKKFGPEGAQAPLGPNLGPSLLDTKQAKFGLFMGLIISLIDEFVYF